MAEIAALVRRVRRAQRERGVAAPQRTALVDKHLGWGAKVSACRAEIGDALAAGRLVAAVELEDDLSASWPADWPAAWRRRLVFVDHHGADAGKDRPSSLRQIFALLGCPAVWWTRRRSLVEANDIGHLPAMRALTPPASLAEMRAIRTADRAAQGITTVEEAEARRAVAERRTAPGLTILTVSGHNASAAADAMEPALGGPGYANLLIRMPRELAFFGQGRVVAALAARVPGSWWGGALPDRGYWGMAGTAAERHAAESLLRRLCDNDPVD